MQKKTDVWPVAGAVVLFVLAVIFSHFPGNVETEHAVLVDFAALVPADGVVELMDYRVGPLEKQFTGRDAVELISAMQDAGITPYSGPKHTPAPGSSWRASCKDSQGTLVFSLSLNGGEICYSNPAKGIEAMYYSLAPEDVDALDAKLQQIYNNG